eukprot:1088042_1
MTYSSNNINPKTRKKAVQSAATKGYYGTKYASPISTPLPNNTGYYKPQSHTQSQSLNNTPYKLGGTKAEDVYIANSISMTETAGIQNIYYTSQKHTQSQSLNNTPYQLDGTIIKLFSIITISNGSNKCINMKNMKKKILMEFNRIKISIIIDIRINSYQTVKFKEKQHQMNKEKHHHQIKEHHQMKKHMHPSKYLYYYMETKCIT